MLGNKLTDIEGIKTEIIIKDYIPVHKGNYNILTGAGGVGKSQIALKMLAHFLQANPEETAVCIFTEDTKEAIIDRLDSITSSMKIKTTEIVERSFFKTLDNHDGKVFVSKVNRANILDVVYLESFILNAKERKVGFIILDPLEAFHNGLNENDAEDMKFLVVEAFQRLGVQIGASVLVLHHTSKGDTGGSRGSGVITNKGRVAYNVRKLMEPDKDLGVDVVKTGWEKSVLLSTIKDNHYIARFCDTMVNDNGKLDLPVNFTNCYKSSDHVETTFNDNSYLGEIG